MSPPARLRLGNGLRVVLADQPGARTFAVSVHYGIGHRAEQPGEEGLAHLFEHLMTQDRHGEVTSAKLLAVQAWGGTAGATTHQDYTDFFQVVPAHALEAVLHWEADRMRAPRFSEVHLRAQLAGVAEEISATVHRRPYGGIPWPLLPAVLFRSFANRHDGYGDVRALVAVTLERCEEFFRAHYAPANAVLTVVGDLRAGAGGSLERLLERHFAGIPARSPEPVPRLDEPAPPGEVVEHAAVPGGGPPVAVAGYRLPDPTRDLPGYLAHVALAGALPEQAPRTGTPPGRVLSASCGFFGPLDARHPDTLVVVAGPVDGAAPATPAAAVDRRLAAIASGAVPPGDLEAVVARTSLEHARRLASPLNRCRDLGRCELLFARPQLALELPERIASLAPEAVSAAAGSLATSGRAVLVATPVGTVHPPAVAVEPARRSARTADFEVLAPDRAEPLPRYHGVTRHDLGDGHRVVAIAHPSSPAVEARLRLRLAGAEPWHAARAAAAVRAALGDAGQPARAQVTSSAGAVSVSCAMQPGDLPAWLRRVATLLRDGVTYAGTDGAGGGRGAAGASAVPADALELAAQSRFLGLDGLPPPVPHGPTPRAQCGRPRADLVLAGAVDDRRAADLAAEALDGSGPGDAPIAVEPPGARGIALLRHAGPHATVVVRAPQPPTRASEAACYLLVAILSGVGGLRAGGRARLGTLGGSGLVVGRDVLAGHTAFFLRATMPAEAASATLVRLHDQVVDGAAPAVTRDELEQARTFCVGQWLAAFDDGATLADTVAQQWSYGQEPHDLPRFTGALRRTGAADVAEAWEQLRAGPPFAGALAGPLDTPALRGAPWPVEPARAGGWVVPAGTGVAPSRAR